MGDPIIDATDLRIGSDFKVWSGHRTTLISGWGRIRIGDRVFVNVGTTLLSVEEIEIGDDVAFGNEVYVIDSGSHGVEGGPHKQVPVRIGDGCWIGSKAIILPGVTLGRRVVVGAGAVVTRDFPDDVMIGGNPARLIRSLSYPAGCKRAWHDDYCACPRVSAVGES